MKNYSERQETATLGLTDKLPPSLESALGQGLIGEEFQQRCETAVLTGLAVVKLRKQKEKMPFESQPFDRLVQKLSATVEVSLNGILTYYGIPGNFDLQASLRSICQFASDLGLTLPEAKNALDWMMVNQHQGGQSQVVSRMPIPKPTLAQSQRWLEETVRSMPSEVSIQLKQIDEALREVYESA